MTEPLIPRRREPLPYDVPAREGPSPVVIAAYELYRDELYRYLVHATRDAVAAEDLLQDTFLRLLAETRAGRTPDLLRPWLYRVASNLVVSRARRATSARRWQERFGRTAESVEAIDSPESDALRREAGDDVEAALARLRPVARVAMRLSAEGFRGTEIAVALGRTDGATRTLLCRARGRLRRDLLPGSRGA